MKLVSDELLRDILVPDMYGDVFVKVGLEELMNWRLHNDVYDALATEVEQETPDLGELNRPI